MLVSIACLLTAAEASAQDDDVDADLREEEPALWTDHRFYVGVAGGVTWASVEHPQVAPDTSFTSALLGLHAGFHVTETLSLGLEFSSYEKYMRRPSPGALFSAASALTPQAGCLECTPVEASGADIVGISAAFSTLGPRVEFAPFGRDGLYVGAFGGVAFVQGIEGLVGAGGAARAGFRLRPVEVLTFAVEGGIQGQVFDGGSSLAPYAMLMLRPYF
jgi:hypothetical protein